MLATSVVERLGRVAHGQDRASVFALPSARPCKAGATPIPTLPESPQTGPLLAAAPQGPMPACAARPPPSWPVSAAQTACKQAHTHILITKGAPVFFDAQLGARVHLSLECCYVVSCRQSQTPCDCTLRAQRSPDGGEQCGAFAGQLLRCPGTRRSCSRARRRPARLQVPAGLLPLLILLYRLGESLIMVSGVQVLGKANVASRPDQAASLSRQQPGAALHEGSRAPERWCGCAWQRCPACRPSGLAGAVAWWPPSCTRACHVMHLQQQLAACLPGSGCTAWLTSSRAHL